MRDRRVDRPSVEDDCCNGGQQSAVQASVYTLTVEPSVRGRQSRTPSTVPRSSAAASSRAFAGSMPKKSGADMSSW